MNRSSRLILLIPVFFLCACSATKKEFKPGRKYSPEELRKDYMVFRHILEAWHPSLYWYTPKDSMDRCFDEGYEAIRDSMTEPRFRTILSYVIARVDCGHTSVRASKAYSRFLDTARLPQFPLVLKFWDDTMVVAFNLNRRDSVLKRGTLLRTINGRTTKQLTDTLFPYIVSDGYNRTGKYQYLSTGLHFSSWYQEIYGLTDSFDIGYTDTSGAEREIIVPRYDPLADTLRHSFGRSLLPGTGIRGRDPSQRSRPPARKIRKERELLFTRSFVVDSATQTGFLTLYTFEHGYHLRGFFRHTFKELKQRQIKHLVIDVRSNGGGDASLSTTLTRYLIAKKFKLADSLYAINRRSPYDHYINNWFIYRLLSTFVSRKREDGKYHFGFFERHYYHPFSRLHFDGQVYILTGGNSFSATCLFAGALKGQSNIELVGEETGGGYYGNTAWMIPDVTLPVTRVRFRLPRYRLVIDRNRQKDGRGIMPDIPALPTVDAIGRGEDFKTAKVKQLIRESISR